MSGDYIPVFQPFSPEAAAISHLFILVLIVCGIILAIVIGMVGCGLIFFRHKPGSAEPTPHFGNRKLEITWTVGPILIVVWLFALTIRGMGNSDPAANQPPDLIVIAHQWWWEVRYPQSGVVTANEIHIPVGKKLLVRLESADVIHDFWVPELARKIDMVPGHPNHVWLEADKPGTYRGECAEFCGAEHARMRFLVIAESPAQFATWQDEEKNPAADPVTDSARQGLKVFTEMTCVNCHSIRGVSTAASAAPNLTHLAGRETIAADALANTQTNLFRWLQNPQAVKPGCFMPVLKLTGAQMNNLVNYLEALK
ncbi:MAG TPA: cytochrome c oxidase subunit II [Verrucomicrobiae bacterium]|jgi:cytochrome c oxidase subunit 2